MNNKEHNERAHASTDDHHKPECYEIRLKGHLDARWSTWFDGLSLSRESDGTTIIQGPVADQAALHGLLRKVRDLGLPLVSVMHVESDYRDVPAVELRKPPPIHDEPQQ
jgi:hypothetical protein